MAGVEGACRVAPRRREALIERELRAAGPPGTTSMDVPPLFEQFVYDVRHGIRTLGSGRGSALILVASPALGIGTNTAMFTIIGWFTATVSCWSSWSRTEPVSTGTAARPSTEWCSSDCQRCHRLRASALPTSRPSMEERGSRT